MIRYLTRHSIPGIEENFGRKHIKKSNVVICIYGYPLNLNAVNTVTAFYYSETVNEQEVPIVED